MTDRVGYYLKNIRLGDRDGLTLAPSARQGTRRRWQQMVEGILAQVRCGGPGDVAAFGLEGIGDVAILGFALHAINSSPQVQKHLRRGGVRPRLTLYDPPPARLGVKADRRMARWLESIGAAPAKHLPPDSTGQSLFAEDDLAGLVSVHHSLDLPLPTPAHPYSTVLIETAFAAQTRPLLEQVLGGGWLAEGALLLFGEAWTPPPRCGGYRRLWHEVAAAQGTDWEDWGRYGLGGRRIMVHR